MKARTLQYGSSKCQQIAKQIVNYINAGGYGELVLFKSYFEGFVPLSTLDVINGTGDQNVRNDEMVLRDVISHITVFPSENKNSEIQTLYRGCNANPQVLIERDGYTRNNGQRILYEHQSSTQKSIFISATTELNIACEFACQGEAGNWVYRIAPGKALSCNEYFSPIHLHFSEHEYVFVRRLPVSQITDIAWALDTHGQVTDFYPLHEHMKLSEDLIKRGIVK